MSTVYIIEVKRDDKLIEVIYLGSLCYIIAWIYFKWISMNFRLSNSKYKLDLTEIAIL